MSVWLFSRLAFVDTLIPPHEVDSLAKLNNLTSRILELGWIGPPLIVSENQALTGTHRIAAAKQAGLRLIPVVELRALCDNGQLDVPPNPTRKQLKDLLSNLPSRIRLQYDATSSIWQKENMSAYQNSKD